MEVINGEIFIGLCYVEVVIDTMLLYAITLRMYDY